MSQTKTVARLILVLIVSIYVGGMLVFGVHFLAHVVDTFHRPKPRVEYSDEPVNVLTWPKFPSEPSKRQVIIPAGTYVIDGTFDVNGFGSPDLTDCIGTMMGADGHLHCWLKLQKQ